LNKDKWSNIVKNVALMIVGIILFVFVLICPLPTMLAIPGAAWRIIVGLLGCFLAALGIYKKVYTV
jgi:di/tricarboxylate transporter